MLKILIVDDDLLVRNKLRALLEWERYGFTICAEAVNGLEALAELENNKPDLVIMDVCMPVIDGIQLCREISVRYKNTKMIVLSSFDNFEYVRTTMKNGAVDYILKHDLNPNYFIAILEKAKEIIFSDLRKQKDMELVNKRLIYANPILLQKYIKELVWGICDNFEQLKDNFETFNIQLSDRNISVVVMQLVNFVAITESYTNKQKDDLVNSVIELCNNLINFFKNGCITYMEQGRFVVLFSFENLRSENEIFSLLKSYIDKIENTINKFLNINTVFGYSNILISLKEIPKAYEKAVKITEDMLYEYDKSIEGTKQEMMLSIKHEKGILVALEKYEIEEIWRVLDEVFIHIKNNGISYNSVQLVICELISIAHKAALNGGMNSQWNNKHEMLIKERLKQCKRIDEIHDSLKALYNQLCGDLKKFDLDDKYTKYIKDSLDFIHKHYKEDISLEDTAKNVNISPSYLSRLFKEEVKMGFSEYLNSERIKAAQKLIENGERRAIDVYSKVGFKNYNYFIRVFKEITGVTPLTYSIKK